MAIKIQSGREYVTESGAKTGVLGPNRSGSAYDTGEAVLLGVVDGMERLWRLDGRHVFGEAGMNIVSEWTAPIESPIRTVTRRIIEDGNSGSVSWHGHSKGMIYVAVRTAGAIPQYVLVDKSELTNIGLIISQLAEFLDEDKGEE